MRWLFRTLFQATKSSVNSRSQNRHRAQPRLEMLEERTLLNNRFVVPVGAATDNVTNFSSLSAALDTQGLSANNTIQIEPGSAPGNVTNADLTAPGVANLTIQGDSTAVLSSIPQFTVSNSVTIGAAEAGFTLKNVNVSLTGGNLVFEASSTITASSLVQNDPNFVGISYLPGSANNVNNVLTNSTVTTLTNVIYLVNVSPGTGTGDSNTITGNTLVASNTSGGVGGLLGYTNLGTATVAAAGDRISYNTFIGNAGSNLTTLFTDNATVTQLTLQNNTFSDPDANVIAIRLDNAVNTAAQATTLSNNFINLTGAGSQGVAIYGGSTNSVTNVSLMNNEIRTGSGISTATGNGGTAILIYSAFDPTGSVYVVAQGNNLQNNSIGVEMVVQSYTPAANFAVDLGGGLLSKGGNDFRGLPTAWAHQGAVLVEGSNPPGGLNVTARNNLFSSPTGIVFVSGGIEGINVDTSSPLTGNAAFVETLYIDLLHRFGDTANPGDAGYWVNQLNGNAMSQAAVANAIVHSGEAEGILVDGLYQKILDRASDPAGRAYFINILKGGGTVEQVISQMVSSPEFANLTLTNANFVQTLYNKVLGRTASSSEVSYWVAQLPSLGQAGVASMILNGGEFRGDVVEELYGYQLAPVLSVAELLLPLLHRTTTTVPAMADTNYWVNSKQDILTMESGFTGTGDYFTNG